MHHFSLAQAKGHIEQLGEWTRRQPRCAKRKSCKRAYGIAKFLIRCGIKEDEAWMLAGSGKGRWRLANTPQANKAMGPKWFYAQGLINPLSYYNG